VREVIDSLNTANRVFESSKVFYEPKLLILVVNHLYTAASRAVFLYNKSSSAMTKHLNGRVVLLSGKDIPLVKIIQIKTRLKIIKDSFEKSPLVFKRDDKYVICSDLYDIIILTPEDVEEYLEAIGAFIEELKHVC
jgi:hypothetical protein